ncbi:Basal-body rod modification protein FlgD [Rhodobacteraceae bacterium THAF1]|uniref:flagellar hook capping FlgD N-terminal domain-containing protein n=1 Tax=Palleronia sp. THAF1 TaxID=2587842 RepID=UPI000F3FFD3D|nr:flagellar hook capping FlgD N-terminal domain-containing protein [Palleronia sp. THAF1]QFU10304.1 Basal-body rod modification protein FlgD [Palleronia sp. THAF1]VDC16791.1 Basal-body rod modification protein FlgD [Rhodobacteraceae bacterium THAF1]
MDISSLAATQNAAPTVSASQPAISSDFQTFLTLLTAQISNQDPLDPMKAEEFSVQLATFSGVEQQVQTNDLLKALLNGSAGEDFTAMTGWIGREVRAVMPMSYDGAPISLDPGRSVAGDTHYIVARDAAGIEIMRQQASAAGTPIEWDGIGPDGVAVPHGTYTFTLESYADDTLVAESAVAGYARVTEIRFGSSGPVLALEGGVEIASSSVSAVREAS